MCKSASDSRVTTLIAVIETIAAYFLAVVTALMFVSVILRYVFVWSIPDTYDLISLLLAILIFWGLAGTGYRGEHISVDLLWGVLGPAGKRVLDVFANAVVLVAMGVLTVMVAWKVWDTYEDNVLTFDLHQPVWVYYALAWVGLLATVVLAALRLYYLIVAPARLAQDATSLVADEGQLTEKKS